MSGDPASVDGYRRYLTIVYSDLSKSTPFSHRLEPEEYHELLRHLRAAFDRIVPHHGGQIVHIEGDGFAILFGHIASHEDTGRRAAEAALDLHAAARELDQQFGRHGIPIRLHTGIHSGLVLVLPGDLVRGRFEMLGEATSITTRLCDLAGPDEILVSEATLGADRFLFKTGPRRIVMPRGHTAAVAVYSLVGREAVQRRFDARLLRGSAPFAGRQSEMAHLDRILDQCSAGRRGIAAIVGPAGIGKTRLAGEFLDRAVARGVPVHRGYCEAYLGARPLQAFAQLARSLLAGEPGPALGRLDAAAKHSQGVSGDPADPLLRLLSPGTAGTEIPPPRPDALVAPFLALLARAGGRLPLILYVDDWQWADDASRQVLDLLAARAPPSVMILVSTRDRTLLLGGVEHSEIIDVPPLSQPESGATIESLLASPDPFLVRRIWQDAGGSPLHIEELCHALLGGGDARVRGERSEWLNMLVQARFSRLSPDLAKVIRTAAIIGHVIPEWLFQAVTGLTGDNPALRQLAAEDFIYPGDSPGTLRFKHGLTRDAIYTMVGRRERQVLHQRVVEILHDRCAIAGDDDLLEVLAHHHRGAGNSERAVHYAERAGDKALAATALDLAQIQYRAAFDAAVLLGDPLERRRLGNQLIHKFGLACVVDPSPDQLVALEEMARQIRGHDNIEGLALSEYWLGALHYGLGRPRQSIAHLEHALGAAEQLGNEKLIAQLKGSLGQSLFAGGDYRSAAGLLDESIIARRRQKAGRLSPGLIYSLGCRGFLLADQGRFDAAEAYYREVEAMLGGAELPVSSSLMPQRSAIGIWKGDYQAAIDFAEIGMAQGERMRSRYIWTMSLALRSYAQWCLDRDPAAVRALVKATAWFMSGASQQRSSLCFGWLADIMAREGRPEDARFYAAGALRRARSGDRLGEAMAMRAMARIAALGAARRSEAHYLALAHQSAERRDSARETAHAHLCAAELAMMRGAPDIAGDLAARARSAFMALGMTRFAALADLVIPAAPSH